MPVQCAVLMLLIIKLLGHSVPTMNNFDMSRNFDKNTNAVVIHISKCFFLDVADVLGWMMIHAL